jgi:hypothetical protein
MQLEILHGLSALDVCIMRVKESTERVDHLRFLGAPASIIEQALETKEKWKRMLLDAMYFDTEL